MITGQFQYSLKSKESPFSPIPGGFVSFSAGLHSLDQRPPLLKSVAQINWILKDRDTNEVFHARQESLADLKWETLENVIVSEKPLRQGHLYETLRIRVPQPATPKKESLVKAAAPAGETGRLGFARGTHIMTSRGEVPVEKLTCRDRLITRDHGMQPLVWIGSRKVDVTDEEAPIVFEEGSIKNSRDLVVSPQHRVVLKGTKALMQYGTKEVLLPAHSLVNPETVTKSLGGTIEYFQLLMPQHEVIYAEAAACESFMLDADNLSKVAPEDRSDIFAALPHLQDHLANYGSPARGYAELG